VKAPIFWIALAITGLAIAFIGHQFAINDAMIREQQSAAELERQSPETAWDPSWPVLPTPTGPPARPIEQVRAAYAFAARRADVLQYIPCYCGCAHDGHRSNENCYLRGRTAAGAPQWDEHAYACGVCLDVTRDVVTRHARGKSVSEIRPAIDTLYVPRYGRGTPTPLPPRP
jgi:hypothetical protein